MPNSDTAAEYAGFFDHIASEAATLPAPRRIPPRLVLAGTGFVVLAALLRHQNLLAVSFWYDEACSWRISQLEDAQMWDAISRDAHPPLFYLLQRVWQLFFGASVISARSLSFLGGLFAVAAGLVLCRTISRFNDQTTRQPKEWALFALAGLFLAAHPLMISMSQQARPYIWGVGLTFLVSIFALKAIQEPRITRNWIGFALSCCALTLTHYYGVFTVISILLFCLLESLRLWWGQEDDLTTARAGGLLVSIGLLQLVWWEWLNVFLQQLTRATSQFWLPPLTFQSFIASCARTLAGVPSELPSSNILLASFWIIIPAALWWQGDRAGRLLALGSAGPLLLAAIFSRSMCNILDVRYLTMAFALLLIGGVLLLCSISGKSVQFMAISASLAGLLYCTHQSIQHRQFLSRYAGLREAASYLNERRQPDEPLLICSPFLLVSLLPNLHNTEQIGVMYQGDYRADLLAGSAVLPQEISNFQSILHTRPRTLWTVDADHLLGRVLEVPVPWDYRPVSQRRFLESSGMEIEFTVRAYVLSKEDSSPNRGKP